MKKTCEAPGCGKEFEAVRSTARFCCPACRVKASREGKQATVGPGPSTVKTARAVGLAPCKPKGAKNPPAADVNALARNVILSQVKTKMPQEDSIEDRLKRLEQAMKQFASKKKPTKEQS